MNASHQHSGRTFTHLRNTDNSVPIILGDVTLTNAEKAKIAETEGFHWKDSTKNDYRNRINTFCVYLKDNDSDYFEVGVRVVTDEDRKDPSLYLHGKRIQYDLMYSGFNQTIIPFAQK